MGDLKVHAKQIDHSFYFGLYPIATMLMGDPHEIERRFQSGGLPVAGNSSDHLYLCVEYSTNEEEGKNALTFHEQIREDYNAMAETVYNASMPQHSPRAKAQKRQQFNKELTQEATATCAQIVYSLRTARDLGRKIFKTAIDLSQQFSELGDSFQRGITLDSVRKAHELITQMTGIPKLAEILTKWEYVEKFQPLLVPYCCCSDCGGDYMYRRPARVARERRRLINRLDEPRM